ncbi:MAG TPA: GNAT family N-acetyltransferase [Actinomycetota bacterium]|nr:GNAT family N-acetyltransferase [Actinomycetota bacterium]
MFITRATRHDHDDVIALLRTNDWQDDVDFKEGTVFIARDGGVVGCVRLVEVEPQTVVVDNVLVLEERRGNGIGSDLMRAAMNSRGGKLYLCCHEDRIAFYERLGFSVLPGGFYDAPVSVQEYWRKVDDFPTPEGHEHFFLTMR